MPDQNVNWEKVTRAFVHPLKVEILEALAASDRPLSPVKLSDLLITPLGTASYHVKQLHKVGLIELVGTEPRRGALEHLYALKVGE